MVRHEAAEALGAVADPGCVALLRAHAADAEPIVAHSCVVALDVLEHEASGAFEYCAAVGGPAGAAGGAAVAAH
jgi:deoxyhypusine monooxygenase